ncbi:MAG: hypothetical protein KJN62_08860 [Deltaproteobacteria bacterium]|nr:hypothetical protein [Deltaproteobacteria bacterium]
MRDRNVNRPAKEKYPTAGVSYVRMTGKPFPCGRGQGESVLFIKNTIRCISSEGAIDLEIWMGLNLWTYRSVEAVV